VVFIAYRGGVIPLGGVVERIEVTDVGVGVMLRPDVDEEFANGVFVSVLLWTGVVARAVFFNVTPCCCRLMGADADAPKAPFD